MHIDTVATALNAQPGLTNTETAQNGVERIQELMASCGLPLSLSELGISINNITKLTNQAVKVVRLLNNNPQPIKKSDIIMIYKNAFG